MILLLGSYIDIYLFQGRLWFGRDMVPFVVIHFFFLQLPLLVRSVPSDYSPRLQIFHPEIETMISSSPTCHTACETDTDFLTMSVPQPFYSLSHPAPTHGGIFCLCLKHARLSFLLPPNENSVSDSQCCGLCDVESRECLKRDVTREVGGNRERNKRPEPGGRASRRSLGGDLKNGVWRRAPAGQERAGVGDCLLMSVFRKCCFVLWIRFSFMYVRI